MRKFTKERVVYRCAWQHCGEDATHAVKEGERVIAYYCDYHSDCKLQLLNDYAKQLKLASR